MKGLYKRRPRRPRVLGLSISKGAIHTDAPPCMCCVKLLFFTSSQYCTEGIEQHQQRVTSFRFSRRFRIFEQLLPVKLGSEQRETLSKRVSKAKHSDGKFCFLPIWRGFGRAATKWTSKSSSASNFAQDRLILRCVRPKIMT